MPEPQQQSKPSPPAQPKPSAPAQPKPSAPAQPKPGPPGKPLWRRAHDAVEKQAAPPLEEAVRTSAFADAVSLAVKLQARVRRTVTNRTAQLLHLANLPAASDITRLREQLVLLDHELRRLGHGVAEATHAMSENPRPRQQESADSPPDDLTTARPETNNAQPRNPRPKSAQTKSARSDSVQFGNSGKDDRNARAAQSRSARPR